MHHVVVFIWGPICLILRRANGQMLLIIYFFMFYPDREIAELKACTFFFK